MSDATDLLPQNLGPAIRPAAVARHIGTTSDAVRAMIRRGELPQPVRLGKRYVFRTEEVREALRKLAGEGNHDAAA